MPIKVWSAPLQTPARTLPTAATAIAVATSHGDPTRLMEDRSEGLSGVSVATSGTFSKKFPSDDA